MNTHAKKEEFIILAGRCPATFLGSRASGHVTVAWDDRCHNHKLPSYTELLLQGMLSYGIYPFGQFGSAALAMSPANFLCTFSLLGGMGVERKLCHYSK